MLGKLLRSKVNRVKWEAGEALRIMGAEAKGALADLVWAVENRCTCTTYVEIDVLANIAAAGSCPEAKEALQALERIAKQGGCEHRRSLAQGALERLKGPEKRK